MSECKFESDILMGPSLSWALKDKTAIHAVYFLCPPISELYFRDRNLWVDTFKLGWRVVVIK